MAEANRQILAIRAIDNRFEEIIVERVVSLFVQKLGSVGRVV